MKAYQVQFYPNDMGDVKVMRIQYLPGQKFTKQMVGVKSLVTLVPDIVDKAKAAKALLRFLQKEQFPVMRVTYRVLGFTNMAVIPKPNKQQHRAILDFLISML